MKKRKRVRYPKSLDTPMTKTPPGTVHVKAHVFARLTPTDWQTPTGGPRATVATTLTLVFGDRRCDLPVILARAPIKGKKDTYRYSFTSTGAGTWYVLDPFGERVAIQPPVPVPVCATHPKYTGAAFPKYCAECLRVYDGIRKIEPLGRKGHPWLASPGRDADELRRAQETCAKIGDELDAVKRRLQETWWQRLRRWARERSR